MRADDMFFLLSGEGSSDIGTSFSQTSIVGVQDVQFGPMAEIIRKIVYSAIGLDIFENNCGLVAKAELSRIAKKLNIRFVRDNKPQETGFHFRHAAALATIASKESQLRKTKVVAVLFRDSDGTRSSPYSEWDAKVASMQNGFLAARCHDGVPMIPRPKSEGWLICAWREPRLHSCEMLELESGNDRSPNSLKRQLEKVLGVPPEAETLRKKVAESFDPDRITMPSFHTFRTRLEAVLSLPAAEAPHV
jgi:hypothetical protein